MCLSSSEFLMYLMSRVRHSEASRFLTLEYIGQVGEHEFRMSLNGPDGDFRVEVGPHTSRICLMGERIWFISESHREGRAYQNIADDVVYGGPIDGRTHAEVIGLFLDVVGILAGATGLFHARAQEGRCDLDPGTRHYDVYVRNAHTGPYRRTLANISFHVNCDADWGADGADDDSGPIAGGESVPTAPVGGAWTRWGTCRWRLDVQGTLWISPDTGWEEGAVGRHPNILGRVPWYPQRRRIRAVHALGVVRLGASASGMFCGLENCETMDLTGLDVSGVEDMGALFWRCFSLSSLDVSGWDTSRVRDMSRMFDWCCSLPSLDVSGWNLSGVECVGEMFSSCLRLKRVTLGPGFSFRPCDPLRSTWYACLPDLLSRPPYTGRWSMEDGSHEMSVTELAQSFGPSLAGTWVWVQRRE